MDGENYLVALFAFTVKSVEVAGFHSIPIESNDIIMKVAILKLQAEHWTRDTFDEERPFW